MSLHPFGEDALEQLANLERNTVLLRRFFQQHPTLNPWAITANSPCIYFPATSIKEVGETLGKDGWTAERYIIWKECLGCRIEVSLPIQTRPFAWEGVQG